VILLDTHVLLWPDRDDDSLGALAREAIALARQAGCVAVSAISFMEAALMHQRGRIDLRRPASQWLSD
jgi:PIN domain nuclease of toxin-antitoxin system